MPLTLSQARQKLFRYVSPSLDDSAVTDRINSALERIYNSGKWKGLLAPVSFNQAAAVANWWSPPVPRTMTLPRKYQAVLGVTFDHYPRLTYPRWQEYIAGGHGGIAAGIGMQKIVDAGDGHVTWSDPTTSFFPRFEITDAGDVGKTVHVSGLDEAGKQVFDQNGNSGLSVELSQSGVSLTTRFSKIISIRKPLTEGPVNLFAVNPDNSAQSNQIASYEPTETVPSYKRYKLTSADFTNTIDCLCKRRFVPLVNGPDDDTVLIPDNEGAVKMTLMALQYEDKNDLERAETYFSKALQLLNSELKEDMGAPIVTLQMNPIAAAMRIPALY
jgi:hypothetical protein